MAGRGRHGSAQLVVVLGVFVTAVAGACNGTAPGQPTPPSTESPASVEPSQVPSAPPSVASESRQSGEGRQPPVPSVGQLAPVRLTIPAIGVDSPVVPVGTDAGVLQVPPEPWVVGWWVDGVGPGAGDGTVVLDAHLDSRQHGTGPFVRAGELGPGDTAALRDERGGVHQYRVIDVVTHRRDALPYEQLFAQQGPERVALVTCGGAYRRDRGGWDSNVVVLLEPA